MFEKADAKVIILIMLMAIILAVTAALAYFYLINRPAYPDGTYLTTVEDQVILVESDPELAAYIISTPVPEQAVAPEITVTQDGQEGGSGGQEENVTAVPVTSITVTPIPVTPIPVTPIPPTAVPRPNQVIFENYQVAQGDTLYSISTKYNTTIALMARYGIDATDIVPGTVIHLPVANPAYCPGNFPYVVEEGDTLSTIAIKCGTTVATLKQINGFGDNYRLDVTSVICVPNPP
jgi:LysM repeat protein